MPTSAASRDGMLAARKTSRWNGTSEFRGLNGCIFFSKLILAFRPQWIRPSTKKNHFGAILTKWLVDCAFSWHYNALLALRPSQRNYACNIFIRSACAHAPRKLCFLFLEYTKMIVMLASVSAVHRSCCSQTKRPRAFRCCRDIQAVW